MATLNKQQSITIFWRILFFLESGGIIAFCCRPQGNSLHESRYISDPVALMCFFVIFMAVVFLGYLAALAWKKKIYSEIFSNVGLGLTIFTTIAFPLGFMINYFIQNSDMSDTRVVATILTMLIVLFILAAILSPFYFAIFQYFKHLNTFDIIKKPYLRLYSYASLISMNWCKYIALFQGLFQKYTNKDLLHLALFVYEVLFLFAFIFRKRVLPQIFWKITAIPFVLFYLFWDSKVGNWDFKMDDVFNSEKYCTTIIVIAVFCIIIKLKILYDYAFTKTVYEGESN